MEPISMANKNLQDPAIIQDPKDPTRFFGILDKNAMESISIGNKNPTRFYGKIDKNSMESI